MPAQYHLPTRTVDGMTFRCGPGPVNLLAADYSWAPSEKAKAKPYDLTQAQTAAEQALLKRWKEADLAAFYAEQHRSRR